MPVDPPQTCAGVGVIVGVEGDGLIVTMTLFEAEHPGPFVTVRFSVTLPDDPAVYVMVWMFAALVIAGLARGGGRPAPARRRGAG